MASFTASEKTSLSRQRCTIEVVSIEHLYEVGVARWNSDNENCIQRPLVEIYWWRHIRFARKRHYFENGIWYTKTYYWTQIGSYDRPFRIRHIKLRTAPPSGFRTMTSVAACKKTSLFRKQCMVEMKFSLIRYRKMLSPFQNPSLRNLYCAP